MSRDFQKEKFYKWERARFNSSREKEMTPAKCTALVEDVCRCYGIVVPKMYYPDYEAQESFYTPSACKITLQKWGRRRHVVLHEAAHHVHHVLGVLGSDHGAEYVSIYSYIISEYMSIPLYQIFHKITQAELKYASTYPKFTRGKPNPSFVSRYS